MALILLAAALALAPAGKAPNSDYSVAQIRKLTDDYAACVVKRRPAEAARMLLADIDNGTMYQDYGRLIDGGCLPRRTGGIFKVTFAGDLYRYALADALVQRELVARSAPDLTAVPPLAQRTPRADPPTLDPAAGRAAKSKHEAALKAHDDAAAAAYLARYGECVVRRDAGGARALLAARPTTEEEGAAFAALRPVLGQCLAAGRTLGFSKSALRGTIAVNYYRLARAAGLVPARRGS